MTLVLNSRRIAAINQLQTTLLTPLEHDSLEDWTHHVLIDLEHLLEAECSLSCIAYDGATHFSMHNVDPAFYQRVQEYVSAVEAGGLRFENAEFDRIMAERRRLQLNVFSVGTISRAMQTQLEQLPWFVDVLRPFGWQDEQQVMFEIPGGEATFAVNPGKHGSKTFSEEDSLAMLALLLPAFRAGVNTAAHPHQHAQPCTSDPVPGVADLVRCIGVTPRQADVTRLLALGLSNDEIARKLGISRHTVRHHCEWVFLKLAVHSRKALALELARRVQAT